MWWLGRFLFFAALLFSASAHAEGFSAQPSWRGAMGDCVRSSPTDAARCALEAQHNTDQFDSCTVISQSESTVRVECRYIPNGNKLSQSAYRIYSCPENSVQSGQLCACLDGFDEKNGQCVEPGKCEQGKNQRLSFLAGWLYEDSEGEWVGDSGRRVTFGKGPWDPPATYCDGSCLWVQDGVVELKWNLDETNANGWSKAVAESDYESTNGECTTKTKDRDDEPPETKPNLNGGGDDNNGGGDDNNGGGGDNNGGGGDNNGGGGDNNGGGDAGGPSGGGGGGDSSGEEDDGKEKKTCGLPGTPPCKIDESGTPGEFKNDGKGLDTWKSSVEANRDQIKGSGGNTFDGFRGFFSAPPLTACRPIDLPGGVAWEKQCEVVDTGRAIMGYVWALVALFCCLGWIREAV